MKKTIEKSVEITDKQQLKFINALKLSDKEFNVVINAYHLAEMWVNGTIKYVEDIQRGVKETIDEEGNIVKEPIINKANVKTITNKILEGNYYLDQITLNILAEEGKQKSKVKYSKTSSELIVESGICALLDGNHRMTSLVELYRSGDEDAINALKSISFPVKISILNKEDAQEQFYQFTLGSKISSSRKEYFNNKDNANKITKYLYQNSVLTGMIENTKNAIAKNDEIHVVSYATLKNAIELAFDVDTLTSEEVDSLEKYLAEFFEELFTVIPEFKSFEGRKELREQNLLTCENFTFYGYIGIAQWLHEKEGWKDLLKLVKDIDFDKTNEFWEDQHIIKKSLAKQGKIKKSKEKVYKYTILNTNNSRSSMRKATLERFKKLVLEFKKNQETEPNQELEVNEKPVINEEN